MSKELIAQLNSDGLLEYGSIIPASRIRELIGLAYPEIAGKNVVQIKRELDQMSLIEMSAVDYVRNFLLGHGKYIKASRDSYRILLPSENKRQIEDYIGSADRKLSRALKLSRSTPNIDSADMGCHEVTTRIAMKRNNLRHGSI
jgi:hypothetical protein